MRRHTFLLAILLGLVLFAIPNARQAATINLWSLRYAAEVHGLQHSEALLLTSPDAHPRAVSWLALRAIDGGDGQKALTLLEPLAAEGDQYALYFMGRALERLGDFSGALQTWKQTGNPEILWRVAEVANQEGRFDDALEAYYAAWELEPGEGALRLANFVRHHKEYRAVAEAVLRQTLAAYPVSRYRSDWLHCLADVLKKQNRWPEVAQIYRQAIAENPDDWEAHIGLGWSLLYCGYGSEAALAEFRRAIEIAPRRGDGYLAMGQVLAREKGYPEADVWFRMALERDPEKRWYVTRANSARDAGELSLALEVYQETIALFPDYGEAYYDMAWAYYLDGQPEQARAAIERALEFGQGIDDYGRVGRIYESAGETEKALSAYQRVLASRPNDRTALEALERLTNNQ
ncbi:MAG: tetratricopeptide repeat protein [Chloroflexi bacterium]|nr:tetratricopeptide repeat protein [Chloroflexota bacterium]